ncbi:MAG: putative lipid II flippase FtsW [Bdellovibrionales bacterium]|nr:putative lipid II flippase FtsW [Bdellovibrionales bacterium]
MFSTNQEIHKLQYQFLVSIGLILILGVVMVYSSSYIYAKDVFGGANYLLYRQLIFACLGIGISYVVSKTKIKFWINYGHYINYITVLFILLTLIPGLGINVKGAHRWVSFFGFSFQPGELLKYSIILSSISIFESFNDLTQKERLIRVSSIILPMILLIIQPDFGTFSICSLVIFFICYLSSFDRKKFYILTGVGTVTLISVMLMAPYRVERLLSYLDPWENPKTSGFQIIQSYLAFANGSLFGQGLGNSNEKLFYLPEAHNDFIFSVIGEELGFSGVFLTVVLFIGFIYFGLKICSLMSERKHGILVAAITFVIGLQALLNMGVVLGLLPTKGLNLPFISYGGSSLVSNLFGIGLILSALKSIKTRNSPYLSTET